MAAPRPATRRARAPADVPPLSVGPGAYCPGPTLPIHIDGPRRRLRWESKDGSTRARTRYSSAPPQHRWRHSPHGGRTPTTPTRPAYGSAKCGRGRRSPQRSGRRAVGWPPGSTPSATGRRCRPGRSGAPTCPRPPTCCGPPGVQRRSGCSPVSPPPGPGASRGFVGATHTVRWSAPTPSGWRTSSARWRRTRSCGSGCVSSSALWRCPAVVACMSSTAGPTARPSGAAPSSA